MANVTITKPILGPKAQAFLDKIKAQGGPPLFELSPTEARKVLLKIQESPVTKLPADIEDLTFPVGPKGKVNVRIVRPQGVKAQLPAVMYFHGGGWILGDKTTHDRLIREIANGAQAAVVFVDYTPSPEAQYPVPIEEAYAATRYVAENGPSLNIDASKLVVAGDSVGGNMVAAVTLMAKDRRGPKIIYQMMFYPVTAANFETDSYKAYGDGNYWLSTAAMKWFWNAYLPDVNARREVLASPLLASTEQLRGLPPALVITDENDVLRDEGEAYARRLLEAGVPTLAVRFLGIVHDFMMLNPLADAPATRGAVELVNRELQRAFKGE